MADVRVVIPEEALDFRYSDDEWARIVASIGEVDELTRAQICAVAGISSELQKVANASPEPRKGVDRLLKLSGRIEAIERELADIWVEEEIAYGLSGDDAFDELASLRETLRRISKAAYTRAKHQPCRRSNNPRGDSVAYRDKALAEWTAIYEAKRGEGRTRWNAYEGRREGGIIDFLIACASPVFDRFEVPVTRNSIAGFLKERKANHRAIMPLGVEEEE